MKTLIDGALRVGLVGLGRHGSRYAAHLRGGDVSGAELTGFWRRNPELAAEAESALGVRAHPTIESLIENVDAVVGVVPAALHRSVAEAAAKFGKPLLLEKPLAATREDARAIAALNNRMMIAQTMRFDPLVRALKDVPQDFGKLVGFGFEQRLEPRDLEWENDRAIAGGGVLLQTGIHAIDALRFVTGASNLTVRFAAIDRVRGNQTEDQALLSLLLDGKIPGDVRTSKIGRSRHHRYQLFFEHGGLEADIPDRSVWVTRLRSRERVLVPERPTVATVLRAFVEWCRDPSLPCPVPVRDALLSAEVVFDAYDLIQRSGGNNT